MKRQARAPRKGFTSALLCAVAMVVGLFAVPAVATAASAAKSGDDTFKWAVQPSGPQGPGGRDYFVLNLAPGQQVVDYVGVSNFSEKPIEFRVYATDAFTTKDGAFSLLPADKPATDVGTWIGFNADTYTVPAGKRLDIPFQLTVPADASPGDHIGGVVASVAAEETAGDGSQRITVDRRVGARVYLRVDGPAQPALKVDTIAIKHSGGAFNPISGGTTTVTYQVTNVGNVRLGANAQVRLMAPFGIQIGSTKTNEVKELLPRSSMTVTETFKGVPSAGRISAKVTLDPVALDNTPASDLKRVSRSSGVWAIPWLAILALLLLAAGTVFMLRRRKAKRAELAKLKAAAAAATAASPAPDGGTAEHKVITIPEPAETADKSVGTEK